MGDASAGAPRGVAGEPEDRGKPVLNFRHPMWIGWGTQMSFLYNDPYIQVLGHSKHEWALGRPAAEVWAEIWDVCGPLAEKVFRNGEATFMDDVRLFMNRGADLEEPSTRFVQPDPRRVRRGCGLVLSLKRRYREGPRRSPPSDAFRTRSRRAGAKIHDRSLCVCDRHVREKRRRRSLCAALSR